MTNLNCDVRATKMVLVGAGCTRGTLGEQAATGKEFGDAIIRFGKKNTELSEIASLLGKCLKNASLEEIWTYVDYQAKFNKNDARYSEALKNAILNLYGHIVDRKAEELAANWNKFGDYTVRRLLTELSPGDTLISLNYDTLIERLAIQGKRLNLHHCGCVLSPRKDLVRFAKPHGSTSWNLCTSERWYNQVIDGVPLLKSLDKSEYPRLSPLVLGAVPLKSELIQEVQVLGGFPRIYDLILHQWRVVEHAISTADQLVVLGYRFPPEDTYGHFFFQEGLRKREKGKPLHIQYYALEEDCSSVCSAFSGKPITTEYMGKVTAPKFCCHKF